jgi:digeranylgeranylglycerophospholipid reductase
VRYDIIVVGAGPAGLSFASDIKNRDALVIDRNEESDYPIKSSAATFTETLYEFGLKSTTCHSSKGFRAILDNGVRKEFLYEKPVLHTIDFKKMIAIFAKRARKNCELMYSSPVKKVAINSNGIKEIRTEDKTYKADIFIDASGESRVLLKHLNPAYYKKQWLAHGIEYEVSDLDLDPNYFDFFFGNALMPEGYSWVFPTSNNSARIGTGKLMFNHGGRKNVRLENALKRFINSEVITVKGFRKENIKEKHGGIMTYFRPLKKSYIKNCFFIGDAASHSSCLLGEGIRFSLKSGKELALALNSFELNFSKIYYQSYIDNLTRLFQYLTIILRLYKRVPNWGARVIVKALFDYDRTNMLRIIRSELKRSDFLRLLYTIPKNMI